MKNIISSNKYSEYDAVRERSLTEECIMKSPVTKLSTKIFASLIALVAIAGYTGVSHAATPVDVSVYLQAQQYDKALPNGETVPMWGFATCTDNTYTTCTDVGAQIDAYVGFNLTININNTLPSPVSLVIPGQVSGGNPVKQLDTLGRERVKSFTQEVAAGTTGIYTWPAGSLKAGTYMYQSGTIPSLQVPMGLYGALVVHQDGTQSYTGVTTDTENVLLFSEVDPVQNKRVATAAATSGTPTTQCVPLATYQASATQGYPCSVDYDPVYFFINGAAQADLNPAPGASVLFRFINAGLRSHSPYIIGTELALIAEDGNLYPGLPRMQSEVLLAAGKTMDALATMPATDSTLKLGDHMPSFNNANQPNGGTIASVTVGAGAPVVPITPSVVTADAYTTLEDTVLNVNQGQGVLKNDSIKADSLLADAPANGSVILNTNGSFTYTPNQDFAGTDYFTYSVEGNVAQVTITVGFVNDAPVANADGPYVNTIGTDINVTAVNGVLANDQDVDGDTLTAVLDAGPSTLTLNADGSFTYTGATSTTFTYHADDGNGGVSDPIVVTLTSQQVSGIALNVVDPDATAIDNYRWLVEEDINWQPDPNNVVPTSETLATNFHKSNMPVVAQGNGAAEFAQLALDPAKHYYVSVLPADGASSAGHTIGGAKINPGTTALTVTVNKTPLKTAQISIIIFEDNSPTNAAVDGNEHGLGGFQITVEDGGGRYGISAGTLGQDVYGNPLKNALDCFPAGMEPPVGVILSCPDTQANRDKGIVGEVLIKNLYQGKYGIAATAPASEVTKWVQTTTIEGTRIDDAWVKAGEPAYFQEFGPAGWHVFIGFVNPEKLAAAAPTGGTNTVTGKVTNMHMSRPPNQTLYDSGSYDALSHTRAWVGINSSAGTGPNFAAVQADADGNFTIPNIPDGEYQLVIWDQYLDQVIGYKAVSLPTGGNVGNVPIFQWFTRTEHNVFLDTNQNGVRDPGEGPITEQNINLRWRDGTVNQSFPTDSEGFVPFDETFPFFHWQIQEVDFARFKPTGVTVTVDGGGDVSSTGGVLNPQVQADGSLSRTEIGPVLTEGFQGFLGQTTVFDWGKAPYKPGENGGIAGIVYYASTRAENNPRLGVGEPWEPGIPSVTVRLYREVETAAGGTALALVKETQTDSWDKSLPTGCPGADPSDVLITGAPADKCYDGLRNFNQVRPGVFDGGYAFMDIPPGKYVVEVVPPKGYELVKEESVNVGFGDSYDVAPVPVTLPGGGTAVVPDAAMVTDALDFTPGLAQPACVGQDHVVDPYLSLFPSEMVDAPYAGSIRPLCDRKLVVLEDQGQAAADFFLYTSAPIAGHFVGMILDDTAQEFNPLSPQFGEKWAPPFVPVSVRDHHGKEISRLYSDQWGRYNGLVPSTFTANMPSPSGYSPAMLMTCMNDPGPIPDPNNPGQMIIDPHYNPAYSNFCYTFQYMPGTTTYLDTPVLPVSSYASGYNPPDCALSDTSPMIRQVNGSGNGPLVAPSGTLTIYSQGAKQVPNPAYTGPLGTEPKTVTRNFDFGATQGTVSIGGTPLVVTSWAPGMIEATAPSRVMEGELVVTRGDNGKSTERAITVSVSAQTPVRVPEDYPTIQAAIDAASVNQLVMVGPGSYDELVIMWKPVRLQGSGAGVTTINGVKRPVETIANWRVKMDCLFGIGAGCTKVVDVLPNQVEGALGFDTEEGAAITVVAAESGRNGFTGRASRIDGFSITGGDIGGGIFVNGYAHDLEISNNAVFGNHGGYHGGIRIGRPYLELADNGPYQFNENVNIHNNDIIQNGGLGGAGGGLSIATGTDNYTVEANVICGNFSVGDGGGIGHLGLSNGGKILNNRITFNQSFNQAQTQSGGGLFIGGEPPVAGGLTFGSGSVTVDGNIIQSNQAGAGHGGGIRTQFVNGQEIIDSNRPNGTPRMDQWYQIVMTNNMITNNVAGWSGGGISMQDTVLSSIVNNTVANNDSTATVGPLVNVNISPDQPAGISSEPNSAALIAAIPAGNNTASLRDFSNPELVNNIVWHNRSFHYDATTGVAVLKPELSQGAVGECTAGANYWDLGVLGGTGTFKLDPRSSILTVTTGYDVSNTSGNPAFLSEYCNGGRSLAGAPGPMFALPALDETGAAWIDVRFGPLVPMGDYHIASTSAGINNGVNTSVNHDFDNDPRPLGAGYDRGADEFNPAP